LASALKQWEFPVAVARASENIPEERKRLLAIIAGS
jgi:hypothetical protein